MDATANHAFGLVAIVATPLLFVEVASLRFGNMDGSFTPPGSTQDMLSALAALSIAPWAISLIGCYVVLYIWKRWWVRRLGKDKLYEIMGEARAIVQDNVQFSSKQKTRGFSKVVPTNGENE